MTLGELIEKLTKSNSLDDEVLFGADHDEDVDRLFCYNDNEYALIILPDYVELYNTVDE